MDSSHQLSIQGTALGHCSLPHPEPGALKHSPPPTLHIHEALVPLTAHPCRAPSLFTNEETKARELSGERTVHSEAPRAGSFFHLLLLVGLEEVPWVGGPGEFEREKAVGGGPSTPSNWSSILRKCPVLRAQSDPLRIWHHPNFLFSSKFVALLFS